MTSCPPEQVKIGYTRLEFNRIFQIYSENVYRGLFRDFAFEECDGRYFMSFREDAATAPLITIEKRRYGPDRALFVATAPRIRGGLVEICRSAKIDSFVRQLRHQIAQIIAARSRGGGKGGNVIGLTGKR